MRAQVRAELPSAAPGVVRRSQGNNKCASTRVGSESSVVLLRHALRTCDYTGIVVIAEA